MIRESRIYYAHHQYKYNTKIEEYELDLINKLLPSYKVLNPNGDVAFKKSSSEEERMDEFLNAVSNCDALVFSSLSGVVGKGVYKEVNLALYLKKPVYYLHDNDLERYYYSDFDIINESNRIYAIVGDEY